MKQEPIWRSLNELDARATPRAPEPQPSTMEFDPFARRDVLKMLGASLALAGAGACTRQPDEKIHAYAKSPEALIPGVPVYFATTMPWPTGALGVLVESHMGRPTKIEGNPDHPASLGATDAFAQAEILSLYDPERAQVVRFRGAISTWSDFLGQLAPLLASFKANRGAGLRILTPTVTSPTLFGQLSELQGSYPAMRWHQWEPIGRGAALAGARLAFGEDLVAVPRFDKAEVVFALDADFLAGPSGVIAMRQFAHARRARRDSKSFQRLYAVESSVSITGAMADERFATRPDVVVAIASEVATALGASSEGAVLDAEAAAWARKVADDLQLHRGKSLVLAGLEQPAEVHALAHAMNHALGNVGNTVQYFETPEFAPVDVVASLRELIDDLQADKVEVLVTLGGNPVYDAPADLWFREAYQKAKLRIALSSHEDETSELAHWLVPMAHFLEAWSDARGFDGSVAIVQPLIAPLYGGKSAHELLAALSGNGLVKPYELVKKHWETLHEDDDFEGFWQRSLHDGVMKGATFTPRSATFLGSAPSTLAMSTAAAGGLAFVLRADPSTYDGRYANNAWLQELPRPLTKITWDNAALISPATAERYELSNGDVVELTSGAAKLQAPVWVTPGHADECVTLPLGYGRKSVGSVGKNVGFDAYPLRRASGLWSGGQLELRRTGEQRAFATSQEHHDMEKRDLVRVREFGAHAEALHAAHIDTSMNTPFRYDGVAFGMVIDLSACVGCNACVIACQAENNIPIVGREQVARGREMHWIRIDRYYEGTPRAPRVLWQPINCMHCENAPCEVVCPVAATTHSPEGLNEMTYNRCVGTRYCSNNCPYKVRRFNFYGYSDLHTESLKLGRNPDVTVRTRGVMEKCTYCVQRIQEKRIRAGIEGRRIGGDEVVTACQQVCPAQAITFGDINAPDSAISKLREEPHHYSLLAELNTVPRTTYLAKVVHSNPKTGGEAR